MLLVPVPLPDEIARGYLGRIANQNGVKDEGQIVSMLRLHVGSDATDRRDHAVIELLASASRSDLNTFLRCHTLLPHRSFITDKADRDSGFGTSRSVLWSQGMKILRTASYFCPQCVEEDISFHGQSYWRRQHQLPGMLLCAKHGCGLFYVASNKALLKPPSHFIDSAFKVCDEWVLAVRANPLYQRFFDIWTSLAECDQSIYVGVASRVFRERARIQGFSTRPGQTNLPLLSDRIVESFGERWLATISPARQQHATKQYPAFPLPHDFSGGRGEVEPLLEWNGDFETSLAVFADALLNSTSQGPDIVGKALREGLWEQRLLKSNGLPRTKELLEFLAPRILNRIKTESPEKYLVGFRPIMRSIREPSKGLAFGRALLLCAMFGNWRIVEERCKWADVFGPTFDGNPRMERTLDQKGVSSLKDLHRQKCLVYIANNPKYSRKGFTKQHYRSFRWLLYHDAAWLDHYLPIVDVSTEQRELFH